MEYRRITKKGQITIPRKFREIPAITAGEKIVFDLEDKRLYLKKLP